MTGDRVFILICRTIGGIALGAVGGFFGIIFGTFGAGWAESLVGDAAVPFGIAAAILTVLSVGIASGVGVGDAVAKLTLAIIGRPSSITKSPDHPITRS